MVLRLVRGRMPCIVSLSNESVRSGQHDRQAFTNCQVGEFLHILIAKTTLRVNRQLLPTAWRGGGERRKECTGVVMSSVK